jgi:hypothetical protein
LNPSGLVSWARSASEQSGKEPLDLGNKRCHRRRAVDEVIKCANGSAFQVSRSVRPWTRATSPASRRDKNLTTRVSLSSSLRPKALWRGTASTTCGN